MNLYELTIEAESNVSRYRHADIDEWCKAIDPVLKAAGKCNIDKDTVTDITIATDFVYIRTEYLR